MSVGEDQKTVPGYRSYATRKRIVRLGPVLNSPPSTGGEDVPLLERTEDQRTTTAISATRFNEEDVRTRPVHHHAYTIITRRLPPAQHGGDSDTYSMSGHSDSCTGWSASPNLRGPCDALSVHEVNAETTSDAPSPLQPPVKYEVVMDEDEAGPSSTWDDESGSNLVLMTFVGRQAGVRYVKGSLSDIFTKVKSIFPKKGKLFSICEKFDTYQKGGLYPLLHVCGDRGVVDEYKDVDSFSDSAVLGDKHVVDQAVYREVAHIEAPPTGSQGDDFVITVAAFRSIQEETCSVLKKNWKSWTGARAFMFDMAEAGVNWQQMTFYARERPLLTEEDNPGFYYILVCRVGIREPRDEGLIVDVLQRFRVERWFGYQTVYRSYRN